MDVGRVQSFEPSCVVPDDPGEVVRGARKLTPEDVNRLREQMIARLMAEAAAPERDRLWRLATDERVRLAMRDWRISRLTRRQAHG